MVTFAGIVLPSLRQMRQVHHRPHHHRARQEVASRLLHLLHMQPAVPGRIVLCECIRFVCFVCLLHTQRNAMDTPIAATTSTATQCPTAARAANPFEANAQTHSTSRGMWNA